MHNMSVPTMNVSNHKGETYVNIIKILMFLCLDLAKGTIAC